MTKLPKDDESLVEFLRQHAGTPPPPAANLEAQIVQAVASLPHQLLRRHRHLWVLPPAIAASLLIAWAGHHALVSPAISVKDAHVEDILVSSWKSVVQEGAEPDWLLVD